MKIEILPGRLSGSIKAIPSKSHAHRALICAALADRGTRIECDSESDDIAATVACLTALGASIARYEGGFDVRPLPQSVYDKSTGDSALGSGVYAKRGIGDENSAIILPCAESGSTFRFMLPVACALGRNVAFDLRGRLPERPLSPLYEELTRHGCSLSPKGSVPFYVSGELMPGSYSLDAGVSSQFISGLLFSLPMLSSDSEIRLTGRIESLPYITQTIAMLEEFGIQLDFDGNAFAIRGGQKYRSPGEVRVEGDWSNAAFWLGAGAIGTQLVTCNGLNMNSNQGDREILDILERFGANVFSSESSASAGGGKLCGIDIDVRNTPDLVPIITVVAFCAKGVTRLKNAGRLRTKESDRLAAMTDVALKLGGRAEETEDELIIYGGTGLKGGSVSSRGDHRIAMAAAIAATVCDGPVEIIGAESVNKSYPEFFSDFKLLGGLAQQIT